MNVIQVAVYIGVVACFLLLIFFLVKRQRDRSKLKVEVQKDQIRSPEEDFYMRALEKTHYDVIAQCSNCGFIVVRYLVKKVDITTVECSKCGLKKLGPVNRTNLTRGFFDDLNVEMPPLSEDDLREVAKEVTIPRTGAGLRKPSRLFSR